MREETPDDAGRTAAPLEKPLRLTMLPERYSICRLPPGAKWTLPDGYAGFLSVTRTTTELSIVCRSDLAPAAALCEHGWRAVGVEGPLAFELAGIVARLASVLAGAGVSIFVVSTFDTDYILGRSAQIDRAAGALRAAGYPVSD